LSPRGSADERAGPSSQARPRYVCRSAGNARCWTWRARAFTASRDRPTTNDLEATRRIEGLFTARPFFGARRIARTLSEEGFAVDRKRVRRLMRRIGIEALGPKPRISNSAPEHKIYPYLLRGLAIGRPNHVCAADISVPRQAA
jgi:putative transposase